jgi:hypothetical protein
MKTYGSFGRTLSKNLRKDYSSTLEVMHRSAQEHLQALGDPDFDPNDRKPAENLADGQRGLLELMDAVWRENENF